MNRVAFMSILQVNFFYGKKQGSFFPLNKKSTFLLVGGAGDSVFRGIAAVLMEKTAGIAEFYSIVQETILLQHAAYFAREAPLTQKEIQHCFRNAGEMAKLLPELACTVRQMTVHEILANPLNYASLFIKKTTEANLPVEQLVFTSTAVNPCILHATANALQLPIILYVIEQKKTLPQIIRYQAIAGKRHHSIILQYDNEQYCPQVHYEEPLKSIATFFLNPHPIQNPLVNIALEKTVAQVQLHLKSLEENYLSMLTRLVAMFLAEEINEAMLLKLYIESRSHRGLEETFIPQSVFSAKTIKIENAMVQELIYALSKEFSLGYINEEIFESIALSCVKLR